MDETLISIEQLKQDWRDLAAEVKKSKKLKFELFESTFTKTYKLLLEHLAEEKLERRCVSLVAEAYLFANIEDSAVDSKCMAAFILTERMLTCCAFNSAPVAIEQAMIYLVEARREVLLNFLDVNESVSKLFKIFDEYYWKNTQTT